VDDVTFGRELSVGPSQTKFAPIRCFYSHAPGSPFPERPTGPTISAVIRSTWFWASVGELLFGLDLRRREEKIREEKRRRNDAPNPKERVAAEPQRRAWDSRSAAEQH